MRQNYRGKYNPGNRPDNDLLTVRMDSEELERTFDSLEKEEKERILEYREEMLQDVKKYLGSDLVETIGVKEYFHNYLKTPLSRKITDEDVNKMIKPTAMTLLAKKEHAIAIMRDAVDKLMKDRDSNGEYYDGRSGVFLGLQIDNNQRLTNHFVVIREKLFFGEQHEFHAALAPFDINKDYQGKSDFLDSKENFQRYQMPYNCHFYPVAGTVDVCIDTKQDAKPTKVHLLYSFSGTDVLYDYLFGDGDKNVGMLTLKKLVDTEGNESKFPSKFFTKMKSFVQKYFTEKYEQYIKTGRRIYGEKSVLETRYIDILPECYIDAMELSREMDRLCNIPIGTLPDSEKKKYIALDVLRNAINEKNTKGRKYELERMERYITKTSELGHLDPSVIITPELKKEELHECMLNFKQKVTFTKEFTEERIYKINAPDTKPQKLVVLSSPEITKVKDNNAVMSFEAFDMISMQKIVCNLF